MSADRQESGGGWGLLARRVAAYLLDILILFAVLAPLGQLILRLFGATPRSGPEIAATILWNFSLPVWLYFILSDSSASGATLGKRLLAIQVRTEQGARLGLGRSLARTAVKLLPWELIHIFAFALSVDLSEFRPVQLIGVSAANLLTLAYLALAIATRGRRSAHDFVAGSFIRAASRAGGAPHGETA